MEQRKVSFTARLPEIETSVVMSNVEAMVCPSCGERLFNSAITERIQRAVTRAWRLKAEMEGNKT